MIGWQRYKNNPDKRLSKRYAWEVRPLRSTYAGAVWAMKLYYRDTPSMFRKMKRLLSDIYREFGWKTRLAAPLIGLYAYLRLLKEEKQLAHGWQYEPTPFYEKNSAAEALQVRRKLNWTNQDEAIGPPLAPPKPVMRP